MITHGNDHLLSFDMILVTWQPKNLDRKGKMW